MGGTSSRKKCQKVTSTNPGMRPGLGVSATQIEIPNFVRPAEAASTFAFSHDLIDRNELGKSLFKDCYPFSVFIYDVWLQIQNHTAILNLICSKSMYQLVWSCVSRFSFAKKSVSDNTATSFIKRSKNVYALDCVDCIEITDTLIEEHLCKRATLTSLNFSGCLQLSDDIFPALSALPNLRILNISECPRISAEEGVLGIACLTTLTHLTMGNELTWGSTRWIGPPFEHFKNLEKLEMLELIQRNLLEVIEQTNWYLTNDNLVVSKHKSTTRPKTSNLR